MHIPLFLVVPAFLLPSLAALSPASLSPALSLPPELLPPELLAPEPLPLASRSSPLEGGSLPNYNENNVR